MYGESNLTMNSAAGTSKSKLFAPAQNNSVSSLFGNNSDKSSLFGNSSDKSSPL